MQFVIIADTAGSIEDILDDVFASRRQDRKNNQRTDIETRIIAMDKLGMTTAQMAASIGCSGTLVRHIRSNLGISVPPGWVGARLT